MSKVYTWALLLLAVLAVSCTEDSVIGDNLQPEGDKIFVSRTDTIPFEVSTVFPDSLQTNGLDGFLFGGYMDGIFGLTRGHIVTQLKVNLGYVDTVSDINRLMIDSIYLILPFSSSIGDDNSVNEVQVYELNTDIDQFTSFYSNYDIETAYNESDLLGSAQYRVSECDTLYDTGSGVVFALKVPLNIELAEELIERLEEYMDNLDAFTDIFKGLVIKSSFGSQSQILVNASQLYSVNQMAVVLNYRDPLAFEFDSVLLVDTAYQDTTLYFEKDTTLFINGDSVKFTGGVDTTITLITPYNPRDTVFKHPTQSVRYYVNSECGRFSVLENEIDTASIIATGGDEYSFVRGAAAMRTRIRFPENFMDRPEFQPLEGQDTARIIINSAKLKFSIDYNRFDVNSIVPPNYLVAYVDDGDGVVKISDLKDFGETYYGGVLSYTDFTYTINVADYVQKVINGEYETMPDILIGVTGSDYLSINEAVLPYFAPLNTGNHPENPMTFKVVYSRY